MIVESVQTIGIYEIAEELGRGAVGVVYRGFDPAIGRPVAIKVIPTNSSGTPAEQAEVKRRFAREGSAAGRLSHPNIVTIYQLGEERGSPYLAMEYVDGPSLEKGLVENRPIAPREALAILSPVAAALDYAHRAGVVHRDIKPSNILLGPDGGVKLSDFGIARITTQPVTQAGLTMGTPAYIAPEQIQGGVVDGKADQFSLAVMAYQMLTGRKPFRAPTDQALLFQILEEEPPEAHEANRHLPEACSAILRRALSKDPEQRFPDCTSLVEALRECLLSPRKAVRRPLTPAEMPPVPTLLPPSLEEHGIGRATIMAIVLVCVGLAVAAYMFRDWTSSQEQLHDAAMRSTLAMAAVDVYFDPGSAQLGDEAVATLSRNGSRLRKYFAEYPLAKVRVEGHTDDAGPAGESAALGSRRAEAAAAELTKAGIPAKSLEIVGIGREQPQCAEATEACRARNNRVHFSLSGSR